MFKQTMLFNVCLAATLVALVAGQSFNPQQCANSFANSVNKYRNGMTSSFNNFSNKLTELGYSSADITKLQQSFQKLSDSIGNMADPSQTISMQSYTQVGTEVMSFQSTLMSYAMNTQAGMKALQLYTSFGMDLMKQNMDFIQSVPSQCQGQ